MTVPLAVRVVVIAFESVLVTLQVWAPKFVPEPIVPVIADVACGAIDDGPLLELKPLTASDPPVPLRLTPSANDPVGAVFVSKPLKGTFVLTKALTGEVGVTLLNGP